MHHPISLGLDFLFLKWASALYDLCIATKGCCWCCWVTSVVSDSVRPHRRQPTRLPRPWGSPGKNTGVGCHFLLQCMQVKSESEVAQSCPTLSDPMDCSLPGSSIHGIFQARVLEWGAIAFSILKVMGRLCENNMSIVVLDYKVWCISTLSCKLDLINFLLLSYRFRIHSHLGHLRQVAKFGIPREGSILGSGRSPGEEHGNSLQYSCLEHPMGRGAWQATVHSIAKSWTRLKQLSTHTQVHCSVFFFFFLEVKFKIPGSGMSSWMTSAMVSFLSSDLSPTCYVFFFFFKISGTIMLFCFVFAFSWTRFQWVLPTSGLTRLSSQILLRLTNA